MLNCNEVFNLYSGTLIDAQPLSMVSFGDIDIEMIDVQKIIDLSVAAHTTRSNENVKDDSMLLESTSKDKDDSILSRGLMLLPFREEWLSKLNNLNYVTIDDSL